MFCSNYFLHGAIRSMQLSICTRLEIAYSRRCFASMIFVDRYTAHDVMFFSILKVKLNLYTRVNRRSFDTVRPISTKLYRSDQW